MIEYGIETRKRWIWLAKIGRWLGIAHRIESGMTYWILTESGKVIARLTVQHITTTATSAGDAMNTYMSTFDAKNLLSHLNNKNFQLDLPNHVFYTFKTMMGLSILQRMQNTGACYSNPVFMQMALNLTRLINILVRNSSITWTVKRKWRLWEKRQRTMKGTQLVSEMLILFSILANKNALWRTVRFTGTIQTWSRTISIHIATMKAADMRYYKRSLSTRKMVLLSTL